MKGGCIGKYFIYLSYKGKMKFIKKIWDKIRPKNAFDLLFFTMLCLIFNIIVLMYKLLK